MSIKKCVNGSFVNDFYREYETATDTITSLPQTIIGDGQPISSWSMKGNMTQSGTPTPSTPIYPTECGEKTANLFSGFVKGIALNTTTGAEEPNANGFTSDYIAVDNLSYYSYSGGSASTSVMCLAYDENKSYIGRTTNTARETAIIYTTTSVAGGYATFANSLTGNTNPIAYIRFCHLNTTQEVVDSEHIMLNEGQTAQSFEPFGYKIPILSNGTTYPVYLAEPIRKIGDSVDTAPSSGTASRVIKKLVLTGEEAWNIGQTNVGYRFSLYLNNAMQSDTTVGEKSYCSHYTLTSTGNTYNINDVYTITASHDLMISSSIYTTLTTWKQYLADQYAAGTPVTVWYVLASPTTESFTAPSIPTSGTAQSFDVDTTLKPSEVSLTYHGWHEHNDTKFTTP